MVRIVCIFLSASIRHTVLDVLHVRSLQFVGAGHTFFANDAVLYYRLSKRILKQRHSDCENMCVVINSGTAFCLRMGTIFHHI